MRTLGVALAVVVLALPGLAAAQVVAVSPSPGGAAPPPDLFAQAPGGAHLGAPGGPPTFGPPPWHMPGPGRGAWWKDAGIVQSLGLSQAQVDRIEQVVLQHRLRLVDLRGDLEKQELLLQPLIEAERPEEAKVAAQMDSIGAARGRLEKEHVLMMLAIRQVLTGEQWKQLQTLHEERARGRHAGPPSGPGYPPPPTPR